jgi:hypothetical protein
MNEQYGIQIQVPFGIYQIVWNGAEMRSSLRKRPTDRFPILRVGRDIPDVPDDENHRYVLMANGVTVGYLTIDAISYGEVEAYQSKSTHDGLKKHHEAKGLTVIDQPDIELILWNKDQAKTTKVERTFYICDFFVHDPAGVPKDNPEHIHVCSYPHSQTKRCGFSSAEDSWRYCPLYRNVLRRTKL